MGYSLRELKIAIGATTKGLKTGLIEAQNSTTKAVLNMQGKLANVFDKKSRRKLQRRFTNFGKIAIGAFAGVTAAATALGVRLAKMAGDFEQTKLQFTQLIGDAGKAKTILTELETISIKTPFDPKTLQDGAKSLLNYGIASDGVIDSVRRLGDLSLGNREKFLKLADAFGKANARFKVTNETLELFQNNGVPILDLLGQKLGATKQEIIEMASKGKINFNVLESAIKDATDQGGQFYNAMVNQADTLQGVWSSVGGVFQIIQRNLGEFLLPAAKEVGKVLVREFTNINNKVTELGTNNGPQIFAAKVGATFETAIASVKNFITQLKIALDGFRGIGEIASIVAGPGSIASKAADIGAVIGLNKSRVQELSKNLIDTKNLYKTTFDNILAQAVVKGSQIRQAISPIPTAAPISGGGSVVSSSSSPKPLLSALPGIASLPTGGIIPENILGPESFVSGLPELSGNMGELADKIGMAAGAGAAFGEVMDNAFNASSFNKGVGEFLAGMKKIISASLSATIANAIRGAFVTNPIFGAILAPIAAGAAKGLFSSLVPSFATGGMVSRPTLAMVGDAGPNNPEYILPERKLMAMFRGGSSHITGAFRMDGHDMRAVIDNQRYLEGRLR